MAKTICNIVPVEFNFQSTAIRTTAIGDDIWFCASDVCDVLGYLNPSDIIKKHCKQKGVSKRYTLTDGGNQELTYINEPNLYRLVMRSRKPEAERFEEWVMEEVLPTLRMSGSYVSTCQPTVSEVLQGRRYVTYFDNDNRISMSEIKHDAFIISEDEIANVIVEPGSMIRTQTVIDIMRACADVMSRRAKAIA